MMRLRLKMPKNPSLFYKLQDETFSFVMALKTPRFPFMTNLQQFITAR